MNMVESSLGNIYTYIFLLYKEYLLDVHAVTRKNIYNVQWSDIKCKKKTQKTLQFTEKEERKPYGCCMFYELKNS